MIGSFADIEELQQWARDRARGARDEYAQDGNLLALGYALAMEDLEASVVRDTPVLESDSAPNLIIFTGSSHAPERDAA